MSKLTLSVNDRVITQAKVYAKQQGVSVSRMVETYLAAVAARTSASKPETPVLRSLRGSLRKADLRQYRSHLASKYPIKYQQ